MSYIKFDGIDGEATETGFEKWIDCLDFSLGVSRVVSGAGGRQGSHQRGHSNAEFDEFSFTCDMSVASTKLMLLVANGKVIPSAEFKLVRSGEDGSSSRDAYSIWKFDDVQMTSFSLSGSNASVPIENWRFSFLKVHETYKITDQKTGGLKDGGTFDWNVQKGVM